MRDRKSISRQSLVSNVEGGRALKHEKLGVHSFERVVRLVTQARVKPANLFATFGVDYI